jgi:hypothetical protein
LALICHDRIDGRAGGRAQITQICDHRGRRRHALAIAPNGGYTRGCQPSTALPERNV